MITPYHLGAIEKEAAEGPCEVLQKLVWRIQHDRGADGQPVPPDDAIIATLIELSRERRTLIAQRTTLVREKLDADLHLQRHPGNPALVGP